MDRGAWWATVHGATESDMIEPHTHTHTGILDVTYCEQPPGLQAVGETLQWTTSPTHFDSQGRVCEMLSISPASLSNTRKWVCLKSSYRESLTGLS